MTTFQNYTPHAIRLNDGREFPSMGNARVSNSFTRFDDDGICSVRYGKVQGLPRPKAGVLYIVSAMVLAASDRPDLVAPATGHPSCARNEKGFIVSVPGFVRRTAQDIWHPGNDMSVLNDGDDCLLLVTYTSLDDEPSSRETFSEYTTARYDNGYWMEDNLRDTNDYEITIEKFAKIDDIDRLAL